MEELDDTAEEDTVELTVEDTEEDAPTLDEALPLVNEDDIVEELAVLDETGELAMDDNVDELAVVEITTALTEFAEEVDWLTVDEEAEELPTLDEVEELMLDDNSEVEDWTALDDVLTLAQAGVPLAPETATTEMSSRSY